MKRRKCRWCGEPTYPDEAFCPECHDKWLKRYTSASARARRALEFDALVRYAREIGLVRDTEGGATI